MTAKQIHSLMHNGSFPGNEIPRKLIETHISWVIICDHFTYKIKKPIVYPFLDFSTVEKRHLHCKKEVALNSRLSGDMYVDVLPVVDNSGIFNIRTGSGIDSIADYVVRMRTMDTARQMNVLLEKSRVSSQNIVSLAGKISDFHIKTQVIYA